MGLGADEGPSRLAAPIPEVVVWLQEYLQVDTTNSGDHAAGKRERRAAELLAEILRRDGIESRLLVSPQGRTSLFARLSATKSPAAGALVLTHHIDVVPAEGPWREGAFSGRLEDGKIWGRGALDIKSLGIAQLATLIALKREGGARNRDLIFLAVADEELGGGQGARFVLEQHPELFTSVEAVLNEGGSNRVSSDRLVYWGVEVVQKRPLWLKVTANGRGGHGAGFKPSSATHQLLLGLARLIERPPRFRVSDAARLHFSKLAVAEGRDEKKSWQELGSDWGPGGPGPTTAGFFLDTLQVTQIENGQGINIIAPEAWATIDIRLLPDTDADAYLKEVRAVLGPQLEVEVLLEAPLSAPSPLDNAFYRHLEIELRRQGPVVPSLLFGTTDSRYFRARGIAAYGFSPFLIDSPDLGGIHAPNEYIRVDDFVRGVELYRRILESYLE